MSLQNGMRFSCQTKTNQDVFGKCVWEIIDIDAGSGKLQAKLVSGTGPSANVGRIVTDSIDRVEQEIASGISKIVPKTDEVDKPQQVAKKALEQKHSGTGIIEF